MKELNELLNQTLGKNNKNYINKEGIKKCKDILKELSEKDETALKVYLYFYPYDSPLKEKDEEFWFIKFKSDNIYDEYDFALDLLKGYIQYISSKDKKIFDSYMIEKIKSFKNYKLIDKFFSILKDYKEKIIATIAYITQDPTFFQNTFNLLIFPEENFQTCSFINEMKRSLHYKRLLLELDKEFEKFNKFSNELQKIKTVNEKSLKETADLRKNNANIFTKLNKIENDIKIIKINNSNLKNDINNLKNDTNNLKNDINNLKNDINNLKNDTNNLKNDINNLKNDTNNLKNDINNLKNENEKLRKNQIIMQSNIQNIIEKNNSLSQKIEIMDERLEKIELRKNIKMSFRYLYNVLKSKFPNDVEDATETSQQIGEIKRILSMPQLKPYEFIIQSFNSNQLEKIISYSSFYTQDGENK